MPLKKQQTILLIFAVIFILNAVDQIGNAADSGEWGPVAGQLLILAVFAYIAYRNKDRLDEIRRGYRERFEKHTHDVGVKDAAIFSLTWSREIYNQIPADRKKLVQQSFGLIGAAFAVILLQVGLQQLLTLILCAMLMLAGVNLLVWVVSTERSEKNVLHSELDTAREMQMSLMPKEDPPVPGFDISGCCLPAYNVGGDLFDYIRPARMEHWMGIAVADVAGKGMEAALTAVFTSGAIVSEMQHESSPAAIMRNLNRTIFSRHNKKKFVSLLLAMIDTESRGFRFVNAGQSKPLLYHDGEVHLLETPGARFPLGLMEEVDYTEYTGRLEPGDILLLYTDGLTEAMNVMKEPFGVDRLQRILRDTVSVTPDAQGILREIRRKIAFYTGSVEQSDDMTMVAVKVA